jgi:hypothetical protein
MQKPALGPVRDAPANRGLFHAWKFPPVAVDPQKTAKITVGKSTNTFQAAIPDTNALTGPYRRLGILLDIGVRTVVESHIDDPHRRGAAGHAVAHHAPGGGAAYGSQCAPPSLTDLVAEYAADDRATNGTGSGTGSRHRLRANGFDGADPAFELGCGAAGLRLHGCGQRPHKGQAKYKRADQGIRFHSVFLSTKKHFSIVHPTPRERSDLSRIQDASMSFRKSCPVPRHHMTDNCSPDPVSKAASRSGLVAR